jgi:hypothetical protein
LRTIILYQGSFWLEKATEEKAARTVLPLYVAIVLIRVAYLAISVGLAVTYQDIVYKKMCRKIMQGISSSTIQ